MAYSRDSVKEVADPQSKVSPAVEEPKEVEDFQPSVESPSRL